ncbi:MAG: hypothetical protein EVJ46_02420 [Candidatus Acididesulfobacter guangdongensis]|uniref:Uncharacterized protein n=1 Tax=Acididesulfobacter guangdongensis TaxID=2597225 RepID=A0A519BIL5_ACIG2|nr:MAG: hypothetical protein EVJ46_02420 [Candidatus Acididesulfobacter guangdongensis]
MKNQIIGTIGDIYSDNNLINLFYSYRRIFSQLKNVQKSDIKKIFQKIIGSYISSGNNCGDITRIAEILKTEAAETFKINKNDFDGLKNIAENEINILDKLNIVRFLNISNNNTIPMFLYYYNADKQENIDKNNKKTSSDLSLYLNINFIRFIREKIYNGKTYNGKFVFITSSRYKNAGIFKFNSGSIDRLNSLITSYESDKNQNTDENTKAPFKTQLIDILYLIGTASEAENALIKNYAKIFNHKNKIILAPHYPMIYFLENYPQYSEFSAISAINPFETNFKYCYTCRNNLISNLASEMVVLYLSKNSSLNNLIKKFEKSNKNVNIIEKFIENNKIASAGKKTDISNLKNDTAYADNADNADSIKHSETDTDIIYAGKSDEKKINGANKYIYELQCIEKEILHFLEHGGKISGNTGITITVDDIINNLTKIVQQINPDNKINKIKKIILQSISLMEIKGVIKREISGVIKKI